MDIYLYCSYENSSRGFYLTRLEGNILVAENLADSEDRCGQLVDRFFTYDDFRILWQEIPKSNTHPFFPAAECGMFGIRGLQGYISERRAVGNLAIAAGADELPMLGNIAAGIITNTDAFGPAFFNCLSVGGPCGYSADAEALRTLIGDLGRNAPDEKNIPYAMRELLRRSDKSRLLSDRGLLRFAVYVATWEQAAERLKPRWLWKTRPARAFSITEFEEIMKQ